MRPGSRAYRRSNMRGPSSSGATALMSGRTSISAAAEQLDRARVLAAGSAGPEQGHLAGDHRLERELDGRRDVADEDHGPPFAHGGDGGLDGLRRPHALHRDVGAAPGESPDLGRHVDAAGVEGDVRAQPAGQRELALVHVDREHALRARRAQRLDHEQARSCPLPPRPPPAPAGGRVPPRARPPKRARPWPRARRTARRAAGRRCARGRPRTRRTRPPAGSRRRRPRAHGGRRTGSTRPWRQ